MIKANITRRHLVHGAILATSWFILSSTSFSEEPKPSRITILFLGDSITAQGGYVREIEAALKKDNPDNPPCVVNRGKPSETVSGLSEAYHPGIRPHLFARLDKELASSKPGWVVACYGINDGIYHPFDEKRFEAYKTGIAELIRKVHAAGCRLILLTAPPYAKPGPAFPEGTDAATQEQLLAKANAEAVGQAVTNPNKFGYRSPYAYYDNVLEIYAAWLLTLNGHDGVRVINLRKAILPRLKECYGADPIHPNATGHSLIASAFLEQWPAIWKETSGK